MSNEPTLLIVESDNDLARDVNSNAIINTNRSAYERAKAKSNAAQRERDELRSATREINNIKCEMHEIKSLLTQLVNKEN
jgi:hypothetical protein